MTKSKTRYPETGRKARKLELVAAPIEGFGWCYGQKLGTDLYAFFDRVTSTVESAVALDDARLVLLCVYLGDGEKSGRWTIVGRSSRIHAVPSHFVLWSYVMSSLGRSVWDITDDRKSVMRDATVEEVESAFSDAIYSSEGVEIRLAKILAGNPGWESDEHQRTRARVLARMCARG